MTEAEWRACADPQPMLDFLGRRVSARKLRLFAVACCRRIWHLLKHERSRAAVEAAERVADGLAGRTALEPFWVEHDDIPFHSEDVVPSYAALYAARKSAWAAARSVPPNAASEEAWALVPSPLRDGHRREVWRDVERVQADFLRCLFGNPHHSPTLPASEGGKGEVARRLAGSIYAEQTYDRLPILADALEEAGCTDPEILAHCRQPGEHVRGCWVVDLLTDQG